MRTSKVGPEGPSDSSVNTVALVSALRFAAWKGVPLRLQLFDGADYYINAPIIIGDDFVQFAGEVGFRPVRIHFSHIVAFELL